VFTVGKYIIDFPVEKKAEIADCFVASSSRKNGRRNVSYFYREAVSKDFGTRY
jgi:hypothetical protein